MGKETGTPSTTIDRTFIRLGETIDALVSKDFTARGISHELYEQARAQTGLPLTTAAAALLVRHVRPGDRVLIFTGWPSRSWLIRGLTETDGPVGAAVLARAIEQGLGAIPIVVMEQSLLPFGETALRAAGLIVSDLQTALRSKPGPPSAAVAAAIAYPTDWEAGRAAADAFLQELGPAALIAVELPGANAEDKYHNVTAREVPSQLVIKADILFREAGRRRIPTIGIGDGGNELGMGNVKQAIVQHLKNGDTVAPVTEVDVLIASNISNWGAYGLAAMLSAMIGKPDIIRGISVSRITQRLVDAGAIDGLTAYVDAKNDGTSQEINEALMGLMHMAATMHLNGWAKG
ncbi:glutamate cyclase domain-containing protein [Paenibacillus cymbidii]|uniref:glutamate cyclase domain-containing protein n=1 Tax=Paenibacillus cymbidii TaxID=1639034 RepID=UPI001436B870|nr:glutamate cyclase domain-containing protein [Paenibacillus cymbidii]